MAERPTSKSGGGKEGQAGAGRVEKRVAGGGGIEKRGGYPSGSRPQKGTPPVPAAFTSKPAKTTPAPKPQRSQGSSE